MSNYPNETCWVAYVKELFVTKAKLCNRAYQTIVLRCAVMTLNDGSQPANC